MTLTELLKRLAELDIQLDIDGDRLRVNAARGALDSNLSAALAQHKAELLEALSGTVSAGGQGPGSEIPHSDSCEAPASFAQERLWMMSRLAPDASGYVLPLAVRLTGPLDRSALQRALDEIVFRHSVLRTHFVARSGELRQIVDEPQPVVLSLFDRRELNTRQQEAEIARVAGLECTRPFDLKCESPYRAALMELSDDEHVLFLTLHHIVSDGWSMGILFRELRTLYAAYRHDEASPLPPLPIQYQDFSRWQKQRLQGENLERLLGYWRTQLAALETLQLPTDRARPAAQTFSGALETYTLDRALSADLRELSKTSATTLFMTMLAVFAILLVRYSRQDDIVLGTPIANRGHVQTEGLIGFFVNMLVLRIDTSGDPTFLELLERVRQVALDGFAHQDVPFEKLVDALDPPRDLSRNPLFQVAFALQNTTEERFELEGLCLSAVPGEVSSCRFDLEAHVWDAQDSLSLRFAYNTDLFDAATIRRMLDHYHYLLAQVVANPERPIGEIELLGESQRRQLVEDWNATAAPYPRDSGIASQFEAQALRRGSETAVVYAEHSLSYAELNVRANRVGRRLRRLGVGREVPVGVLLERSLDMVVAWLGVLKAGGAYVPLDPEYPSRRLQFMLGDTQAPVLLSDELQATRLADYAGEVLCLDRDWDEFEKESGENLDEPSGGEDLAYVIYTSGSTGGPKGVAVPHRAVLRLVCNTDYVQLEANDCVVQSSNASFDAATFEVWGALLNGARLEGVDREVALSPVEFGRFLRERGASVLFLTTALFNQMVREAPGCFSGLRALLFGGEAVEPQRVRELLSQSPPQRLLHVYGPTESTTFATWHEVEAVAADARTVPIGRPIRNTTLYVLDTRMQPVVIGIPGELYLGGDGLARGYFKREALTRERFVASPFGPAGARLYRTGDLVRRLEDGTVEFLGRLDHQVKLRGFRIELGEVEAALGAESNVGEALVLCREDQPGDRRLVAYVAPALAAEVAALSPAQLRSSLREKLPEYMVPSRFVVLEHLPLTVNGKVDRGALPAPEGERQVDETYIAPRGELAATIAAVWGEVLGVSRVGVHDNFFDLGGNSLLLVTVHERLQKALGKRFPVLELFRSPTVDTLRRHLFNDESDLSMRATVEAGPQPTQVLATRSTPIAIVAMSGRFPGAANVEAFWNNLCDGIEGIERFSDEELRAAGVPETLLQRDDFVKAGTRLGDIDQFDAEFFGYPPATAAFIDPQQRLFLECCWEVVERAGHDAARYPGRIGVYAGVSDRTYLTGNPEVVAAGGIQAITALGKDHLATRVAYHLNLRGPGLTVQTACSTSLVAVHLAVQALRDGDCDMAIAGGASVRIPEVRGYLYQEQGIQSRDGHCRAFDAKASGTVAANGVAAVLLKRLDDALADGDPIYALIRQTAINNDGSSKVGYTAPGIDGQAEVVALAQRAAGIDPRTISYIETHGTGTALGDPIEIAALSQVFRAATDELGFCAIGSLKSNLGHLDAAAGVSGLIKTALALRHRTLPPSLHYEDPNPEIDFAASPFYVNTRKVDWQAGEEPLRAGVSSFGIGGTNAHAILEQGPPVAPSDPASPWQLIVLSARTPAALDSASARLAEHLRDQPQSNLADVAHTLQIGRREFACRRAIAVHDMTDAVQALEGAVPPGRVLSGVHDEQGSSAAFLFPGQGTQYLNMGAGVYRRWPVFRDLVDQCCELLQPSLDFDLRTLLYPAAGDEQANAARLDRTAVTQPALFVVEYALARLWMSWGVKPVAMIGHSLGEYVAACIAGVMSLPDALALVAERGRLMDALSEGSMLAVTAAVDRIEPLLGEGVSIASINAPDQCVVSGSRVAIEAFAKRLPPESAQPTWLHTSHAFHSQMMDPILKAFEARVAGVELLAPRIPYVSNLSGQWITHEQATDPGYYSAQLRGTVQFSDGLACLLERSPQALLEVGPGRTLAGLARGRLAGPATRSARGPLVAGSLPSAGGKEADEQALLEALGRLWIAGLEPLWGATHAAGRRRRLRLPTYPFERRRHWIETDSKVSSNSTAPDTSDNPSEWLYAPSWRRMPSCGSQVPQPGSQWLVLASGPGPAQALAPALRAAGARVAVAGLGTGFARDESGGYTLAPGCSDDYSALLADLATRGAWPEHIVHAWSFNGPDAVKSVDTHDRVGFDTGLWSVVQLVRALAAHPREPAVRLSVITEGAHAVHGGEAPVPTNAALVGLCTSLALEHPELRCRLIDLRGPGSPETDTYAQQLVHELCAPGAEPLVACRAGRRWLPGFESIRIEDAGGEPAGLRKQGIYLLIGGLGEVGLELAGHLARRMSARLVLVGRTGLPEHSQWAAWVAEHGRDDVTSQRIERILAMERAGAEVMVIAADATHAPAMRSVLAQIDERFGSLDAIMYLAAAERQPASIVELQREDGEVQLAPKVGGLQVLARVLKGRHLDFVLVHSSLASVLGVAGFALYSAAHAWMDAFATAMSDTGTTPWRVVNWDNWNTRRLAREHFTPGVAEFLMEPEPALQAFDHLLALSREPQIFISTGDLTARARQWLPRAQEPEPILEEGESSRSARPVGLTTPYEAPRTEAEKTLVAIWEGVLGIVGLGIHDNFFELGGDSVLNLQIAARANERGLKLAPRLVFEQQTIAELAAVIPVAGAQRPGANERIGHAGDVPLLPAQRWFLDLNPAGPEHFNQALLFKIATDVDPVLLGDALTILANHHEALQLRFTRAHGEWHQRLAQSSERINVDRVDLSGLSDGAREAALEERAAELHGGLDLAHGPVLRARLFDLGKAHGARLLMVIHHLVVDAVSWRILIEDLTATYAQLSSGRQPAPLTRSTSVEEWAARLERYACSPEVEAQRDYWCDAAHRGVRSLPRDRSCTADRVASSSVVHAALNRSQTEVLQQATAGRAGLQLTDVLLAALTVAIGEWSGHDRIAFLVEGHGREALFDDLDLSRTVGWFTNLYPVVLPYSAGDPPERQLSSIAESLHAVPGHGMGYALLRYMSRDLAVREVLTGLPPAEISFLHLGQIERAFVEDALIRPAMESAGPMRHPAAVRAFTFELSSALRDGALGLAWEFGRDSHATATVEGLLARTIEVLGAFVEHLSRSHAEPRFTASDLSSAELSKIMRKLDGSKQAEAS